jgi:hypothetical protein
MEEKVRDAVRVYLATAVAMSPEDAPLHVLAVAKQTGFDRKTLKKYGLDMEIAAAAEEQAKGPELSPREVQRRSQADALEIRKSPLCASVVSLSWHESASRKATPSAWGSIQSNFGNP